MTVSTRGRLRRLWFNVHLWIGVGLSLLLIPLGLTGSALVWGDALLRSDPGRVISGPAPASQPAAAYLAAAAAALAGAAQPQTIRWPAHPGDPVEVVARPMRPDAGPAQGGPSQGGRPRTVSVLLNPSDARILSKGAGRPGWWMTLHGFHENLLVRGWGRPVVGWLGVAMLLSSLTGIWLWWPRSGAVLKGFRFRRTPGFWLNLHHMAGFWISLPLAFASLTGAALGFPQQTRALIAQFAPVSAPRGVSPGGGPDGGGAAADQGDAGAHPGHAHHGGHDGHGDEARSGGRAGGHGGGEGWRPALTPDAALAKASGVAGLRSLALPSRGRPLWRIDYADGHGVQVDDATGVVSAAPPRPGGDVFIRWLHRLHGGTDLPLLWRLILTLAGLAPALLGITGVSVWVARRTRSGRPAVD